MLQNNRMFARHRYFIITQTDSGLSDGVNNFTDAHSMAKSRVVIAAGHQTSTLTGFQIGDGKVEAALEESRRRPLIIHMRKGRRSDGPKRQSRVKQCSLR